MAEERPLMFIGSSVEGLEVAEAIQANLEHTCECVIWSQGVFGLGGGTLETLVEKIPKFDFAILVMTPDDLVESPARGEGPQPAARDNVLIEVGLCIGELGRKRTFGVYDREAGMKVPSDLAGITLGSYQTPSENGNLQSALGATCTTIKAAISELGFKPKRSVDTDVNPTSQFQIIHGLLDSSAEQFLILMHEQKLGLQRDGLYSMGIRYECATSDWSFSSGQFSISQLCNKLPDADLLQINLRNVISLTQRGGEFADWLIKRGYKAKYFKSDLGSWGEKPDFPPGMLQPPINPPPEEE